MSYPNSKSGCVNTEYKNQDARSVKGHTERCSFDVCLWRARVFEITLVSPYTGTPPCFFHTLFPNVSRRDPELTFK